MHVLCMVKSGTLLSTTRSLNVVDGYSSPAGATYFDEEVEPGPSSRWRTRLYLSCVLYESLARMGRPGWSQETREFVFVDGAVSGGVMWHF